MSKNKLIPLILAAVAVIAVIMFAVTLSNRRSDVIGDETYTEDTEAPSETLAPEGQYPLSEVDWKSLYEKNGELRSYNPGSDTGVNTPYYFYYDRVNDMPLLGKSTQILFTLCRDAFCKHEDCFNSYDLLVESMVCLGDRIYLLSLEMHELFDDCYLYSVDTNFNDLTLECELPKTVNFMNGLQSDGQSLYWCEDIYNDQGECLYTTIVRYDPQSGESSYLFEDMTGEYTMETLDIRDYNLIIRDDMIYTVLGKNMILRISLQDLAVEIIAEVETPTVDDIVKLDYVDDRDLVYHALNGSTHKQGEQQRLNLDTLEISPYYDKYPEGYTYMKGGDFGDEAFLCIDHSGDAYKDDPFHDFYTDMYTMEKGGKAVLTAGRIYRLTEDGELVELAQLTTDGVPDLIGNIMNYDGRFLYVTYRTYTNFKNELNPDFAGGNAVFNLAVIDTQTGKVWKPCEIQTETKE